MSRIVHEAHSEFSRKRTSNVEELGLFPRHRRNNAQPKITVRNVLEAIGEDEAGSGTISTVEDPIIKITRQAQTLFQRYTPIRGPINRLSLKCKLDAIPEEENLIMTCS